jgi:putative ABC transport system substrate-binding protein
MLGRRACLRGAAALVVAAARTAWPRARRIPLVVWLGIGPPDPGESQATTDRFRSRLRELGYVEGRDIVVEYRHANRAPERLPLLIEEQLRQRVDVILSARSDVVLALMRSTSSMPIVFAAIDDPVGSGIVESLARPGRNVTGVAWDSSPAIAGKQFELLRELVPGPGTFALLWKPDISGAPGFERAAHAAARSAGVPVADFQVHEPAEFDDAFAAMAGRRVVAVQVLGSWFTWAHREAIARLAARHRLPAIYGNRDSVLAGGLMSYGANIAEQFRRAAVYVDRILRGALPGDLPVEQPTTFELVVSLQAARVLGITIPGTILLRADELIG